MRALSVLAVLVLSGCVADHNNKASAPPAPVVVHDAPPVPAEVSKTDLERVHSESLASSNLAQQSISGLGANIAKIADKMTGVEGDLSAAKAEIRASVAATATLTARVDTKVDSTAIAALRASIQAELRAQFQAQFDAHAAAIAGLNNRVDTTTNTAGRDIRQRTEYTKEMADTLVAAYQAMVDNEKRAFWAIVALTTLYTGCIVKLMHGALHHERKKVVCQMIASSKN